MIQKFIEISIAAAVLLQRLLDGERFHPNPTAHSHYEISIQSLERSSLAPGVGSLVVSVVFYKGGQFHEVRGYYNAVRELLLITPPYL